MEIDCVTLRPRRWLVASLLVGIFVSVAAALGGFVYPAPVSLLGLNVGILLVWALHSHAQRGAFGQRIPQRVTVTSDGLRAAGLEIPRRWIVDGYYQPARSTEPSGRVRLTGNLGRVLFEAELAAEQARAMLHELALDAASHRAELRAASPLFATIRGQLLLAAAIVPLMWLPSGGLGYVAIPLFLAAMWPARIFVGIDGFLWRWLVWKRFVPMTDVRDLSADEDRGVRLTLGTGESVVWHTSIRSKTTSIAQSEHRDAVLSRMRAARAHAKSRPRAADLGQTLGQAGRSRTAWLEALRQLRAGPGDYRAPAIPRADLWLLLEDPSAPEDARAGAAFVLHGEDRVRLQQVAETTASPGLRMVLESAAEGDEPELLAALERQRLT